MENLNIFKLIFYNWNKMYPPFVSFTIIVYYHFYFTFWVWIHFFKSDIK